MPPPPATAPPSAPAPTAQITATPTSISAGDQVVLNWRTTDATSVSIDGIGQVPTTGVKTVTPTASTTYHLSARGDGGMAEATTRVTVQSPPAVSVPTNNVSAEEEFRANVQDIFFDYDAYDVRGDAQATLSKDASYLAGHPNVKVVIGGYCDERGSNEYNLALGERRSAPPPRTRRVESAEGRAAGIASLRERKGRPFRLPAGSAPLRGLRRPRCPPRRRPRCARTCAEGAQRKSY